MVEKCFAKDWRRIMIDEVVVFVGENHAMR